MKPDGQKIFLYTGIIIGGICFILGMAIAIAATPIVGSIITFLVLVLLGWAFGLPYLRSRKRNQLLATGKTAKGKIVEMWDTGITINNQPQIGMVIEVTPDFEPAFKAKLIQIISRLETFLYQAGTPCVVKYDPNDKSTVAIESLGDSGSCDDFGHN